MPETRASNGADAVFTSTPTRVDAVLDHGVERARELELVDVVLVLADADRLRIDLHQFGERILQPARDRNRAAQGHVEAGQLLRRVGRGGIDRRPGFRHHDLLQLELRQPLDQLDRELVGLARGGAVADRDQLHPDARAPASPGWPATRPSAARLVRIDRAVATTLPVASTTATFTPVRIAGVQSQHRPRAGRARRAAGRAGWRRTPASLPPRRPSTAAAEGRSPDDDDLDAPRPAHGSASHLSPAGLRSAMPKAARRCAARRRSARRVRRRLRAVRLERQVEDLLAPAAEQRQHRGATASWRGLRRSRNSR